MDTITDNVPGTNPNPPSLAADLAQYFADARERRTYEQQRAWRMVTAYMAGDIKKLHVEFFRLPENKMKGISKDKLARICFRLLHQLSPDTLRKLASSTGEDVAAWHEAGHYVVATRLGVNAVSKIDKEGDGSTTWQGNPYPGRGILCAISWAGPVAQMYFLTGRWNWNWMEADAMLSDSDRLVIRLTEAEDRLLGRATSLGRSPRVAARMFLRSSLGKSQLAQVAAGLKAHGVYPLPKRTRCRRTMASV